MNNYLDGFDRKEATLQAESNVSKGNTVAMSGSFAVKTAADGEIFAGVCTKADSSNASVLLKGYAVVSYTGTAPACGYVKLSADGKGGIKTDENGRYVLVTNVDTVTGTCGIVL